MIPSPFRFVARIFRSNFGSFSFPLHSSMSSYSGIAGLAGTWSSFLPPQPQPEIQLARLLALLSLTASGFSWTSLSGRGLLPVNVVCLSEWDRGGDCDCGVEISPESPLKLDVSLLSPLVPGKFPDEGAWLPLGIRPGVPITPAVGKKAEECLWLMGGEAGLSGPLYIWLTRLAAPGN